MAGGIVIVGLAGLVSIMAAALLWELLEIEADEDALDRALPEETRADRRSLTGGGKATVADQLATHTGNPRTDCGGCF